MHTQSTCLCKTGAFGFAPINNPYRINSCTVEGVPVTRSEAFEAISSRINNTVVLVNSSMSKESLDEAVSFAKNNNTDIMYFNSNEFIEDEVRIFGEERKVGANADYINSLEIKN